MSSVSLRPTDVSTFADRLLHDLPRLRGQLKAALGASGRAAAVCPPGVTGALHDVGADLQTAVAGLDTSLTRLAAALKLAAADLITHDAQMFGLAPQPSPAPASLVAGATEVSGGGA